MKSHKKILTLNTSKRKEFVNITQDVASAVAESGIQEGIVLVNSMHITSSIFINDEESGLKEDFMQWLEELAPVKDYSHHRTGEDNGDAHLKREIMGREVTVAISEGKLDFGPWEQIFYGEFDGQRQKSVMIKIIGE
jgi:secondary thiamine-phosphate synthase enzyme